MTVEIDSSRCFENVIGQAGLSASGFNQWLERLKPAFDRLKQAAQDKSLAHIAILSEAADVEEARQAYSRLINGARTLVIFGTGGSSLGGQALAQAAGWNIPGDKRDGVELDLVFFENLDAISLRKGLETLDLATTRFLVISKSGSTGETLSQMLTALGLVRKAGLKAEIPNMFLGLTEPDKPGKSNGLRDLCKTLEIPTLPHRTDIGGRYAAFTNVGMFPAFAVGIDFAAFRAGGQAVVDTLLAASGPADFEPAKGAALAAAFNKDRGISVSVMMPYADRLARFSAWYVQLWAESLGKNDTEGTTPVGALGPVDQHSQLQLYLGGAQHHLVTIIRRKGLPETDTAPMPEDLAKLAGAAYLAGRTVGQLVYAQTQAIGDAFAEHKRPLRLIDIEKVDEWTLGWLMMHFILETILTADLFGVDPFDQPAVELGKVLTRDYLGRMA
ncbi:MAG TPA: glucose-6-phosphate isomerase [Hyphomicrobiales bacterium]|nr:glucose-6-phosphate isomerase [Hyphomicrobiales bacterium]